MTRAGFFLLILSTLFPLLASADEGGVSFWFSGQMGSFAATPADPGWSMPITYYHAKADAKDSVTLQHGTQISAGIDATTDLFFFSPTYVFKDPFWDGQLAVSLGIGAGGSDVKGTGDITFAGNTLSGQKSDRGSGLTDLFPQVSVRWNQGLHNFMAYGMFNILTGDYDKDKLANMGLGHSAVDMGGAYTYLDSQKGREFSATLGVTYNLENSDTNYQNGLDAHVDLGAGQFLSDEWMLGLVGYYYFQLTKDTGSGVIVTNNSSSVGGFGPQAGYFFNVGNKKWFANLKGYGEFAAQDRPAGWNLWATLAIPL